ncbi:MAG TPA: M28 family peptidase, partial [Chthoniobacterales bacterium]|nr:M28 family peptidase [Chthoniobacterales bacterium]
LGADVRVEKSVGVSSSGRYIQSGPVENIVATIHGSTRGRAVMLASHYDSAPNAPGAADAGSGVGAILEAVRALKTSAPLKNDLLILYTDSEEEGLVGASAFVREHADLAQRVGLVLNLEARGSSGAALMFETSNGNGWLTREFARAAPYPYASSLAYAVYERMPNDTDLTVFKRAGLQGLNFAFSGTFENYHTARDTPENLDARSLQQLGANVLALTRHFGNLGLPSARQPDRVYFNWFGSRIIGYQGWFVWVILAADLALLVAALVIGRRRQIITLSRTAFGALTSLLIIIAAGAATHVVSWAVYKTSEERLLVGDTWSNLLIALGCVAAALAFAIPVQAWLASRLGGRNSAAGQLLAFALLTAAVSCLLPGASYLFQWPLLFALVGFLVALNRRRSSAVWTSIATLPALLIFAPLTYLLFVIFGLNSISLTLVAAMVALLLALASPLMPQISRPLRVSVPALVLCSFALILVALQLSRFSAEHPRRNSIVYGLNADTQKAAWISYDEANDDWTEQFLTAGPIRGSAPELTIGSQQAVLRAEAEPLAIEPPSATVISDSVIGERRVLKLHVTSPRRADVLLLRLTGDVELELVVVNGRAHKTSSKADSTAPWLLRYNAPPPEGVELELHVRPLASFSCWLGDRAYGLPEISGKTYRPRPPDMMPTSNSDQTVVTRQLRF